MDDYISREAALACIEGYQEKDGSIVSPGELPEYQRIERLPAADVRENRRGEWVCSDDMYETAVCSCCGWDTTEPWQHIRTWFMFCPHCGADMREKRA